MVKLQRRADLLWEQLAGSVALLDSSRSMAHSLDGAAAAVWMACEQSIDRAQLETVVAAQGHDARTVESVIDVMIDADLLVVSGGLGRRALLRHGATAAAVGAVLSIALPEPAAALSTGGPAPEFFNTPGFDVNGTLSTPPTQPVIASLDSATTPDSLSSSAAVYVASNPTAGSIDWPADLVADVWTFSTLDLTIMIEATFGLGTDAYNAFMAATSLRIDFFDEAYQFTGTAYFPDPA